MTRSTRSRTPKFTTKTEAVRQMLGRPKGATVAEIMSATKWQNHSVRAFFTLLRKKGEKLVREERPSGEATYRIERSDQVEGEVSDVAAQ